MIILFNFFGIYILWLVYWMKLWGLDENDEGYNELKLILMKWVIMLVVFLFDIVLVFGLYESLLMCVIFLRLIWCWIFDRLLVILLWRMW